MTTLHINRAEAVAIPFMIVDEAGGLDAKRVTWSLAHATGMPAALTKASDIGASSPDVFITTATPYQISGTIFLGVADFEALPEPTYCASLWIDSGEGDDRNVSPGGADFVVIRGNAERA